MKKVAVIGGGAAGMMAAVAAAENGHHVTLFEKNEKLGKKIYITGKGRCNVTNACDASDFFDNVVTNPKFLYSSIYGFDSRALMEFIEAHGTPLKIERGNRVFPVSDHASDITRAFERALKENRVDIHFNERAERLLTNNKESNVSVCGIKTQKATYDADAIILATGGLSYPSTGSNGDGFKMLEALGIKGTKKRPALTSLLAKEEYVFSMQGLSLKNVSLSIYDGKKQVFSDFGEMLFTHKGISGPIVLSASSIVGKLLEQKNLLAYIDLKPAIEAKELDKRLIDIISDNRSKNYSNFYKGLLPSAMMPVMIDLSSVHGSQKIGDISKEQRHDIMRLLKSFPFTLVGCGGFNEAVITQGGVDVRQVDPGTMRVKSIDGLFVAGEMLDVDGFTGGFNLHIAFATGYCAGKGV